MRSESEAPPNRSQPQAKASYSPSPASAKRPSGVCSTSPSTSSESSARSRCAVSVSQATSSCALDTGESLPRNTSSSRPRTWRSVPAYRWARRGGCRGRRIPARPPRAHAQRAQPAPRRARRAHRRAELHQSDRKPRRVSIIGQQGGDVVEIANRRRRVGAAVHHPGHHPADVGVDDGHPAAVGEAGDGPRGVGADSGKRQQGFDVGRHHVAVFGGDHRRALVQPLGATGVAELSPRPQHVGGAGGGGRRRRGPARDPVAPDRLDAGHRCLLKHELADQNLPRRDFGPSPGQVTLLARVPVEQLRHNVGHAQHQPSDRMESTQGG